MGQEKKVTGWNTPTSHPERSPATGGAKSKGLLASCIICLLLTASCGEVFDLTPWDGGGDDGSSEATSAIEATATYAVPLGGTASGRDELVIYDAGGTVRDFSSHTLGFQTDNNNIGLTVRPGFNDFASGSGALIIPIKVGSTIVTYKIDGVEQTDKYKVVVPPQSLIQILLGEARGQIEEEAQIKDGNVALSSESPTANAIGAVIRNRVSLLEVGQPLELFIVDETAWNANPPASHWDAVITAENHGVYQFSPLNPLTASHEIYAAAVTRSNLSDDSVAYDQAALTAAGIFSNEINDPTGGAFAFRTPTAEQAECLTDALANKVLELPLGCGPGDENFPTFDKVQVLIHPSVAKLDDGRPSFVFYRNRSEDEPAVTNAP